MSAGATIQADLVIRAVGSGGAGGVPGGPGRGGESPTEQKTRSVAYSQLVRFIPGIGGSLSSIVSALGPKGALIAGIAALIPAGLIATTKNVETVTGLLKNWWEKEGPVYEALWKFLTSQPWNGNPMTLPENGTSWSYGSPGLDTGQSVGIGEWTPDKFMNELEQTAEYMGQTADNTKDAAQGVMQLANACKSGAAAVQAAAYSWVAAANGISSSGAPRGGWGGYGGSIGEQTGDPRYRFFYGGGVQQYDPLQRIPGTSDDRNWIEGIGNPFRNGGGAAIIAGNPAGYSGARVNYMNNLAALQRKSKEGQELSKV